MMAMLCAIAVAGFVGLLWPRRYAAPAQNSGSAA
jgi:hypothetical protein